MIDCELQEKLHQKMLNRPELVNEYTIDLAGMDAQQVLDRALEIIRDSTPLTDYEYDRPPKELFYSWVFSNGLR